MCILYIERVILIYYFNSPDALRGMNRCRYPLFQSRDDMDALTELALFFGAQPLIDTARSLGGGKE